jgi:hypothetical protein
MNPKLLFISAVPNSRRLATAAGSLTWGGGGTMEDMCYDRLRAEACVAVWTSLPITH